MSDGTELIRVTALGAQGDGVARDAEGRAHHIPLALPGETWRLDGHAPPALVEAAADRASPPCRHFGVCGGCVAQHMPPAVYAAWKRDQLVAALGHRGLSPPIGDLVTIPAGTRRRATLAAWHERGRVRIGYHGRRSHERVALEECPVLRRELVALLPLLCRMVELLPRFEGEQRIGVTWTGNGADIAIDASGHDAIPARQIALLAAMARDHGLARISVGGRPVVELTPPRLAMAGKHVVIPPGAFVQAAVEAEVAITGQVLSAIGKARQVADLFCGVGTLTLPIATRARVTAFDADGPSVAALAEAIRHNQGLKPVVARVRDLFRDPLSPLELKPFDAVVLDPPRAGARAQCESLARSKVPTVVMVSCNPATLARDTRTLVDGGYVIDGMTPIDQFVWSAHVEAVAVLRRRG